MLLKPRLDDAEAVLEYVSDPEVMRWIGGETGDLAAAVAASERRLGRCRRISSTWAASRRLSGSIRRRCRDGPKHGAVPRDGFATHSLPPVAGGRTDALDARA